MNYEEKISWLSRYREAEKLYQRLSYRLAEAQEATRHITQNLSAAPGGSKDGQSLARAVERQEEAERRAYAQLAVCDALFAEIDAVLVQLDSAEYCALRKYYLDCLKSGLPEMGAGSRRHEFHFPWHFRPAPPGH